MRALPHAPRLALLAFAFTVLLLVAHESYAVALIENGVAGALLAGGGGTSSIVVAALFVFARVVGTVAVALLPAYLVHRLLR